MEIRNRKGKAAHIRMLKPADMHQHVRRGAMLKLVVPMIAKRFSKAIIMPNTKPPITTYDMAVEYRKEIRANITWSQPFWPLMTLYLTDQLDPHEVRVGRESGIVAGVKYYPRGLTTNSDSGVKDPASLWTENTKPYMVLRELADCGGVLLLHAADGLDKNGNELDPWDQEKHFIKETLPRIRDTHPTLKISVEHLSTKEGATYMEKHGDPKKLGCSLTAQHLLLDRRDMFRAGFRPHRFWWPIIQRQEHKEALRELAKKGHSFVWLGSDSAPHPIGAKETDCCSGGVLMAHAGIELYVEAFEDMGALDKLEDFASINGPRFFGLSPSGNMIEFVREEWEVERTFQYDKEPYEIEPLGKDWEDVVPFRLGEKVRWKLIAD